MSKRIGGITVPPFMKGTKIYSFDWFWKYNLSYTQAVERIKALGMDYVIALSKYLPMSNSAVDSEIPREKRALMEGYDDLAFRQALQSQGIAYFGGCNFFFDPPTMKKHGNIPVDEDGQLHTPIDWYYGACPTCESYVEEKITQIEIAMERLKPDGIFLGFTRFPGFWELWLPETQQANWKEYCFCERCVGKFKRHSGVHVPLNESPGKWIKANVRDEWTAFKCQVIYDVIFKVRSRIQKINPSAKIILNTVPFNPEQYANAGKEVFAQDPKLLSDIVDIFEVMCYHQILGRDPRWIAQAGEYFKKITEKMTVCTIQVKPLYLGGMHARKGRAQSITPQEFTDALHAVKNAPVDGCALFTWTDLLAQNVETNDMRYSDAVKHLS